ncbi:hypothetical protein [Paenibacillus assamensis]|uniref:hypothetical protein n=1 Tax=Paenibacillus assamensis TaxID=311244 RepID=UPI00041C2B8E|nr:hypothetical protein [Paenibacillus assamensis]
MKIWRLLNDEKSRVIVSKDEQNEDLIESILDGERIDGSWEYMEFVVGRKKSYKDFPRFLPGVPVFPMKTLNILLPLIEDYVQLLPGEIEGEEVRVVNVLSVIECADYKSEQDGFQMVLLYLAKDKILNRGPIFKLAETLEVIVTDEFRNLVLESKLKGFEFEEVWDLESESSE